MGQHDAFGLDADLGEVEHCSRLKKRSLVADPNPADRGSETPARACAVRVPVTAPIPAVAGVPMASVPAAIVAVFMHGVPMTMLDVRRMAV